MYLEMEASHLLVHSVVVPSQFVALARLSASTGASDLNTK